MSNGLKTALYSVIAFVVCFAILYGLDSFNNIRKERDSYKSQLNKLKISYDEALEQIERDELVIESCQDENKKLATTLDTYRGMYEMVQSLYKVTVAYAESNGIKFDMVTITKTAYDLLDEDEKALAKEPYEILLQNFQEEAKNIESEPIESKRENDQINGDSSEYSAWDLEGQGVKDAWKSAFGELGELGKTIWRGFKEAF